MTSEPESPKASKPRREMLTVDQLPLYATDAELAPVILGKRAKNWPAIARHFEGRGLPQVDALFGGRYVPAVVKFFDALNGVTGDAPFPSEDGIEKPWMEPRKRRGKFGVKDA
jgi:hypothetical protein